MTTIISVEPPSLYSQYGNDGDDETPVNLFAKPLRLLDINPLEIYTRDDPNTSVGERLKRVFQERGDFSQLTVESIRQGVSTTDDVAPGETNAESDDGKMTPEEMRELQSTLLEQLNIARNELTTALDLLSVLAPVTIPPSIDPDSLPLPSETLITVPTLPFATSASDPTLKNLGLATSLSTIKSSAAAFFQAFEEIMSTQSPQPAPAPEPSSRSSSPSRRTKSQAPSADLWTTLLSLRSTTSYPLLPLGAARGATLTGSGESRAARAVGVFYGCEEALTGFRRAAVARVGELLQVVEDGKRGKMSVNATGRKLVVSLTREGEAEEIAVWDDNEGTEERGDLVKVLKQRGRCAFAEELFSILSNEVRLDSTLKARLTTGKRSSGDTISMQGYGWSISFTMVINPPSPTRSNRQAQIILSLIRLLLLEQYSQRRASLQLPPIPARSILQNVTVLLTHTHRLAGIQTILQKVLVNSIRRSDLVGEVEYWLDGSRKLGDQIELGLSAMRIVRGDKELGGRAVLRIASSHLFHLSYSLPLPFPAKLTPPTSIHPSLLLQSPHTSAVPISSLVHLETFLTSEVESVIAVISRQSTSHSSVKAE